MDKFRMVERSALRMRNGKLLSLWSKFGASVLLCIGSTNCASQVVGYPDDGANPRGDSTTDSRSQNTDVTPETIYRDVPIQYEAFVEDTCPGNDGARMTQYACDPFRSADTCEPGTACYPYIDYPSGVCEAEVYRSECLPVGGIQADHFCTSGDDCAPGLACFVTGAGNRCLLLCNLNGGFPECPRGQICEPTDIPDYGACD